MIIEHSAWITVTVIVMSHIIWRQTKISRLWTGTRCALFIIRVRPQFAVATQNVCDHEFRWSWGLQHGHGSASLHWDRHASPSYFGYRINFGGYIWGAVTAQRIPLQHDFGYFKKFDGKILLCSRCWSWTRWFFILFFCFGVLLLHSV